MERRPTQGWVESAETRIMLDAGGALPEEAPDAVLLTHFHLDHCQGLIPVRWAQGESWNVYAPRDDVRSGVIFGDGGRLAFHHQDEPFTVGTVEVSPIPLQHGAPTLGWLLEDSEGSLAYLVDTHGLPEVSELLLRARGVDLLILDCTYPPGFQDTEHNDFHQALAIIEAVEPRRTLLVHVGHELDCWRFKADEALPAGVEFARDGQSLAVVQGK